MESNNSDSVQVDARQGLSPESTATNPRKRIWTCLIYPLCGVFIAILLQALMGVALVFVMMANGAELDDLTQQVTERVTQPDMFILTIVLGQFGFALATFIPGFFSKEPFAKRFGLKKVSEPLRVYGYTMTGSIFVLAVSLGLVYLVTLLIQPDKSLGNFFEAITPGWGILFVIVIAVFPGFIEEALFRGYIQQRLMTRWSPFLAIGVASILFALVHITPFGIAVALPLGIWFGYISWRVDSIWPTIACHAFVNGGLNTWRLICKFFALDQATINIFHFAFVAIGLVGFILACRFLAQHPIGKTDPENLVLTK